MPNSVDRDRRRLLKLLACLPAAGLLGACTRQDAGWPAWQAFVQARISADGRVIDHATADRRSTSEGQAYALFFALVRNDVPQFERILQWTTNNLAQGDLGKHLPAWLWGRNAQGQWQVLDTNPASDADLWLGYTLLEAGRLWQRMPLWKLGAAVIAQVRAREVVTLPGLGPMLLPAPKGFVHGDAARLNLSYLPVFLLRRLISDPVAGPWDDVIASYMSVLRMATPKGFAPDWVLWRGSRLAVDPDTGTRGSYDAIRCYLWAGMLSSSDPAFAAQLHRLEGPMRRLVDNQPMWETVDTATGAGQGTASAGFQAALLPYLAAQGAASMAARAWDALQRLPKETGYYNDVLQLFGTGWYENRFRFDADGSLLVPWG